MKKCRAILRDGTIIFGVLTDGSDVVFEIFTNSPKPNDHVRVCLGDCKKITITDIRGGNANSEIDNCGEQAD